MYGGGRGDYGYGYPAAGDYYRGGFFGNLFRGAAHVLGGAALGFLTGGPAGAIRGAIGGTVSGTEANIKADEAEADVGSSASGTNPSNLPVLKRPAMPATRGGIITTSPLGTPVSQVGLMKQMHPFGMRRVHPNKSTYVTRGGGTSRWPPGLAIHPKGTEQVPTRRMNVANARALRRALRRVAGFAKITKRVRRAVSMAASAVGVRHHARKAIRRR